MKKPMYIMLFAFAFLSSCSEKHDDQAFIEDQQWALEEKAKAEIVVSGNNFGMELFNMKQTNDENILLCPAGIYSALALLYGGAGGEIEKAFEKSMGIDMDKQVFLKNHADLIDELNIHNCNIMEMDIKSAIWIDKDLKVKSGCSDYISQCYPGCFDTLNFSDKSESAGIMNKWVEKATHNNIKKAIGTEDISDLTTMMLANAVHFMGKWANEFSDSKTDTFLNLNGTKSSIDYLYDERNGNYFENNKVQMVQLPYSDSTYEIHIVLPKLEKQELPTTISLHADSLRSWESSMEETYLELSLPRLRLETEIELNDILQEIGLGGMFTGNADFSGISDESLYISTSKQKIQLEFNKEGTLATSITFFGIDYTSCVGCPEPVPVVFKADHPYYMYIKHKNTNSIVYLFRISDMN